MANGDDKQKRLARFRAALQQPDQEPAEDRLARFRRSLGEIGEAAEAWRTEEFRAPTYSEEEVRFMPEATREYAQEQKAERRRTLMERRAAERERRTEAKAKATEARAEARAERELVQPAHEQAIIARAQPRPKPRPPGITPYPREEEAIRGAERRKEELLLAELERKIPGAGQPLIPPLTRRHLITATETLRIPAQAAAGALGAAAVPAHPFLGYTGGAAALGLAERVLTTEQHRALVEEARKDFVKVPHTPFDVPYLIGGLAAFPMILPTSRSVGRAMIMKARTAKGLSQAQRDLMEGIGKDFVRGVAEIQRTARISPRGIGATIREEAMVGLPLDWATAVGDLAAGRPLDAATNLLLGPTAGAVLGTSIRVAGSGVTRGRELRGLILGRETYPSPERIEIPLLPERTEWQPQPPRGGEVSALGAEYMPPPLEPNPKFANVSDDDIQARRLRDLVNFANAKAEELSAQQKGFKKGTFARGRQTQAANRLKELDREAQVRGLPPIDDDLVTLETARPWFERNEIDPDQLSIEEIDMLQIRLEEHLATNQMDGEAANAWTALQVLADRMEGDLPPAQRDPFDIFSEEAERIRQEAIGLDYEENISKQRELELLEKLEANRALGEEGRIRLDQLRSELREVRTLPPEAPPAASPDVLPVDLPSQERMKALLSEGLTTDEAAARLKAEHDALDEAIRAATREGDIYESVAGPYKRVGDQWIAWDTGTGYAKPGVMPVSHYAMGGARRLEGLRAPEPTGPRSTAEVQEGLFGDREIVAEEADLFGAQVGTEGARPLEGQVRAAKAEIEKLEAIEEAGFIQPDQQERLNDLRKLVHREEAISAEEMAGRARAEEQAPEEAGAPSGELFIGETATHEIVPKVRTPLKGELEAQLRQIDETITALERGKLWDDKEIDNLRSSLEELSERAPEAAREFQERFAILEAESGQAIVVRRVIQGPRFSPDVAAHIENLHKALVLKSISSKEFYATKPPTWAREAYVYWKQTGKLDELARLRELVGQRFGEIEAAAAEPEPSKWTKVPDELRGRPERRLGYDIDDEVADYMSRNLTGDRWMYAADYQAYVRGEIDAEPDPGKIKNVEEIQRQVENALTAYRGKKLRPERLKHTPEKVELQQLEDNVADLEAMPLGSALHFMELPYRGGWRLTETDGIKYWQSIEHDGMFVKTRELVEGRSRQEISLAMEHGAAAHGYPGKPKPEARPPEELVELAPEQGARLDRLYDAALQGLDQNTIPTDPRKLRDWAGEVLQEVYDGKQSWSVDELYDALEAALHTHWIRKLEGLSERGRFDRSGLMVAREEIAIGMETLLANRTRSLEISKLQQFSTPIPLSEGVFRAADIRPGDNVLEPTAGTGSLLAPFAHTDARLVANELDPRRVMVLDRFLAGSQFRGRATVLAGDGLRLAVNNPELKGTFDVVVGNPPWRKGAKFPAPFAPIDLAERFVVQGLEMLRQGGRMVFLMPTTILENGSFKRWLVENHTLRALIQSPPGAYKTRGTNVESVLLVVDKGRVEGAPVMEPRHDWLTPQSWDEYYLDVASIPPREAVEHAVEAERPTAEAAGEPTPGAGRPERPAGAGAAEPTGRPVSGVRRPTEPKPAATGAEGAARPEPAGAGPGARPTKGGERPEPELGGGARPRPEPSGLGAEMVPGAGRPGPKIDAGTENVVLQGRLKHRTKWRERPDDPPELVAAAKAAEASELFVPVVSNSYLRGGRHPRLIVETRSLAGAPLPEITVRLSPKVEEALGAGRMSEEQFEQAAREIQANLLGHGYVIADNVGVGKSRIGAAVLIEWLERPMADRVLLISKSRAHLEQLWEEFQIVYGEELPYEKVYVGDYPEAKDDPSKLPQIERGVYMLQYYDAEKYPEAILQYSRFDAMLVDEAHLFRNIDESARGQAFFAFHEHLMKGVGARERPPIAYMTATPGQSIEDLEYLYGLREWSLDGFEDWKMRVTGHGDIAASVEAHAQAEDAYLGTDEIDLRGKRDQRKRLSKDIFNARISAAEQEQIIRELKRKGKMWARDLWRAGTEFEAKQLELDETQLGQLDAAIGVARAIEEAFRQFGRYGLKKSPWGPRSMLQNYMKRLNFEFRLPHVIREIEESLAKGEQPVVSLISVSGEQRSKDLDVKDGNSLLQAAIRMINTEEWDKPKDGTPIKIGDIPEALQRITELEEMIADLPPVRDPIDAIEEYFGAENVAAITGRTNTKLRVAVMDDFQAGNRPIAIISKAGKEGINLHDVNGKRRHFIVADFDWSATDFIQRLGRVDRSGQVSAPRITILHIDTPGELKFAATVASRLTSLGAVSRGGAKATGVGGALDEFDLADTISRRAMRDSFEKLPQELKDYFFGSPFSEPVRGHRGEILYYRGRRSPTEQATVQKYLLELQLMPKKVAEPIVEAFLAKRHEYMTGVAQEELAAALTKSGRGEVQRVTELANDLVLYEVKNETNNRFGILEGLITPSLTKIQQVRRVPGADRAPPRHYMTFQAGDEQIGGLVLQPSQIKRVAKLFGKDLQHDFTPERALDDLKVGEHLPIFGAEGTPWVLRQRRDGRIAIDGAKMQHAEALERAGAKFEPAGRFFLVPEENLQKFLERFPIRQQVDEELLEAVESAAREPDGPVAGFHQMLSGWRDPNDPRLSSDEARRLKTRHEILTKVQEALEMPAGIGKFRHKARAIFKIKPEVMREKIADDIISRPHEWGHAIHKMAFGTTRRGELAARPLARFRQELWALVPHVPQREKTREGAAEFFRAFVADEATARQMAPTYYHHIVPWLETNAPEVLGAIRAVGEQYRLYREGDPRAVFDMEIDWGDRPDLNMLRDMFWVIRDGMFTDLTNAQRFMKSVNAFAKKRGIINQNDQLRLMQDVAQLMQLYRGADLRAHHWTTVGPVEAMTAMVDREGPSLLKAFGNMRRGELKDFIRWLVAMRTLELMELRRSDIERVGESAIRNVDTPRQWRAQELVDLMRSEGLEENFRERAGILRDWFDRRSQYLVDMGVLTQEARDAARERHRWYVPFYREMYDQLDHVVKRGQRPRGYVALFNPMRRIRESGRRIINPLESVLKQLYRDERLAHRAQIVKALVNISKMEGGGRFVERLPAPPKAHMYRTEELLRALNIDEMETERLGIDPEDLVVLFTKGEYHDPKIISNIENGKRVWYEVKDMSLVRDLQDLDPVFFGAGTRFMRKFASFFRFGTVLAPAFPIRNVWRDQFTRAVFSVHGTKYLPGKLGEYVGPIPFEGFLQAFGSWIGLRDPEWRTRFEIGGGGLASMLQAMTRRSLRKEITGLTRGPVYNMIRHPADMLAALLSATENATRLAEAIETWKKLGITDPRQFMSLEQAMEGGLRGSEVSVDFRQVPRWGGVRWLSQITAFYKPGLLGYERMVREFVTNPDRALFRSILWITMPTMALYAINKDDPEYWDLPQWQRDMFWLVKMPNLGALLTSDEQSEMIGQLVKPAVSRGDQVWLRIPKPFELGTLFGAIPERILAYLQGNDPERLDKALADTGVRGLVGSLVPVPTIFTPLLENVWGNTFFFNTPVEPERLKGLPIEERYTERTSELARNLSRWMNGVPGVPDMSPVQWENIIYGYGSSLGREVGQLLDPALRFATGREQLPEVKGQGADIPFFGVLTGRWPTASAEPVHRFWRAFEKNSEVNRQVNLLRNTGQLERLAKYAEQHIDEIAAYQTQQPISEELRTLGQYRRDIRNASPGLTPDERREAIDIINLIARDRAAEGINWPHFTPDSAQMENRQNRLDEILTKMYDVREQQVREEEARTQERIDAVGRALQEQYERGTQRQPTPTPR